MNHDGHEPGIGYAVSPTSSEPAKRTSQPSSRTSTWPALTCPHRTGRTYDCTASTAQTSKRLACPMRKDQTKLQINRLLRRRPVLDQIRPHRLGRGDYSNRCATAKELTASEEQPGGTTERTSDPPPLAGPAAGCGSRRAPETSFEPAERDRQNLRPGRLKSIRSVLATPV